MTEGDTIVVKGRCPLCKEPSEITVDHVAYDRWRAGEFVQVAFPNLSRDDREMLISGSHPECFDAVFGGGQ